MAQTTIAPLLGGLYLFIYLFIQSGLAGHNKKYIQKNCAVLCTTLYSFRWYWKHIDRSLYYRAPFRRNISKVTEDLLFTAKKHTQNIPFNSMYTFIHFLIVQ